jgi:hypothetical protein
MHDIHVRLVVVVVVNCVYLYRVLVTKNYHLTNLNVSVIRVVCVFGVWRFERR